MATQIDLETGAPSSYCPNCLGKMSSASPFCASCGSQTAIEISVAKLGDAKIAYSAARTLHDFDAPAIGPVAELAKSLQVRNFHFRSSKGWPECEALVETLGTNKISATARYVVVTPADNSLASLARRPAVRATAAIIVVAGAVFLATAGKPKSTVTETSPVRTAPEAIVLTPETAFQGVTQRATLQPDEAPPAVGEFEEAAATPAPARFSFEAARRSIVTLKTQYGLGTGFVIAPGYILTNRHVLEGLTVGGSVDVLFVDAEGKPRTVPSRVHRFHKDLDLSVVRCSQDCEALPVLPLGRSADLETGATVYAIGSPLGLALTLSRGILSNVARNFDGALFLQSDVQVNPGNSGGPLLNERGEVIGVVTAKVNRADGISFILPIEYASHGPDAVLDGIAGPAPDYEPAFSARLAALQNPYGMRSETARNRAEEAAKDMIVLMGAAVAPDNRFYVKFRIKWNPTSAMPPNGPFYIVIQQKSTGYKGTFQLTDLKEPIKLGELEGGARVYEFEHLGQFQGIAKFDLGDKVSVRMRDDIFSNVTELSRR